MQPGGSNDAYGCCSVNGFNRSPTDRLGTGAPPPWRSSEYAPVNSLSLIPKTTFCSSFHLMKQYFPYGHFAQGGNTHARFPVVTEQISNNAMNVPHFFPGTSTRQSNQGATPIWQLSNLSWANHEAQGELHLTIVFRKFPVA
ncbi:hypothetical protein V8E53_001350 [Lactarius tabidus]